MDEDLKTFLFGMENRLGDLLVEQIKASETRIEEHVSEQIRDLETKPVSLRWSAE